MIFPSSNFRPTKKRRNEEEHLMVRELWCELKNIHNLLIIYLKLKLLTGSKLISRPVFQMTVIPTHLGTVPVLFKGKNP